MPDRPSKTQYRELLSVAGLQQLQDRLCASLGLAALVTSPKGEPITAVSNLCSFCTLINRSEEGRRRCEVTRVRDARYAAGSGRLELRRCHAGLVHLAVPLTVRDETVAVVVGGNLALEAPEESAVVGLAAELGIPGDELVKAARGVPVWTQGHLEQALETLASVAGVLGQLVRLTEELRRLIEIGQKISSSLDAEEVLNAAVESAADVVGVRWCTLRLVDESSREMVLKASHGLNKQLREMIERVPPERNLAATEVLRTGQPLVCANLESDGRFTDLMPYYLGPVKALAAVPIVSRGKVLGVLKAYSSSRREWTAEEVGFLATVAAQTGMALDNARLFASLRDYYLAGIRALAAAVEAKDIYTRGHSLRVADWAKEVAREMGLSPERQENVYVAGVLHDIGKIAVNEGILLKAGPLTPEERQEMQSHPAVGAKILEPGKFPTEVLEAVRYHHEAYGGGGYPEGIAGEEIPLLARIICVADAYDAMTTKRPYRGAHPGEWALEELRRCSGKQFDPEVVEAFMAAVGRGEHWYFQRLPSVRRGH